MTGRGGSARTNNGTKECEWVIRCEMITYDLRSHLIAIAQIIKVFNELLCRSSAFWIRFDRRNYECLRRVGLAIVHRHHSPTLTNFDPWRSKWQNAIAMKCVEYVHSFIFTWGTEKLCNVHIRNDRKRHSFSMRFLALLWLACRRWESSGVPWISNNRIITQHVSVRFGHP